MSKNGTGEPYRPTPNKRKIELKERIVITGNSLTYPEAIDWVLRNKHRIDKHDMALQIGCNRSNLWRYLNTAIPTKYHQAVIHYVNNFIKIVY